MFEMTLNLRHHSDRANEHVCNLSTIKNHYLGTAAKILALREIFGVIDCRVQIECTSRRGQTSSNWFSPSNEIRAHFAGFFFTFTE